MEEWLTDSNEALELRLVRSPIDADVLEGDEVATEDVFSPAFTYPIFGEQEKIFGYQGLNVQLHFASGSLKQYLNITYDEQLKSEATPAEDIEGKLYKFIPADYTKSETTFHETVEADATTFRPLGEKLAAYVRPSGAYIASLLPKGKGKGKGKASTNGAVLELDLTEDSPDAVVYEIYKATWSTPGFKEYHRRMQLFILLFIEGGSYVHEDEDAWEFYVLYERRKRADSGELTYHFVGYTSVYPFWCYPNSVRLRLRSKATAVSDLPSIHPRQRQQQQQPHGFETDEPTAKLYSALYQHCLSRPDVAELTVEDPAEAFEDLRDRNDLRYLVSQGLTDDPKFLQGIGASQKGGRVAWETEMRKKYKIAQRQFDRLLEMLLLKQLDKKDLAKAQAYRLHVKARLYRFNYVSTAPNQTTYGILLTGQEMLCQMTSEERKTALAKTYESVVEDYERLLEMTFH